MRLIDSHCHVDLYPDYKAVIAEIERAEIYTIAVTNTPSVFQRCAELLRGARFIRPALGLHPELAVARERELSLLDELLPTTRYVGEIGLDYTTEDAANRVTQRRVFSTWLERCAEHRNKILTVHSRRAAADAVAMIGDEYPGVVILHWFTGSHTVLSQAVERGCYFSMNLAMLSGAAGRRVATTVPKHRVLTETDGPFVMVNGRAGRPPDIKAVVSELARLWQLDTDAVAWQIHANFRAVLTHTQDALLWSGSATDQTVMNGTGVANL